MQKILIGVVIGVAIVLGGYFLIKPGTNSDSANSFKDEAKAVLGSNKMTVSELMKKGGSYKCTWSQDGYGGSTKGMAYINDGMLKVEQNAKTASTDMDINFLSRDEYIYNWSSVSPNTGSKLKIQENMGNLNPGIPSSSLGMFLAIYDQLPLTPNSNYACTSWSADASVFTPPTNITFVGN